MVLVVLGANLERDRRSVSAAAVVVASAAEDGNTQVARVVSCAASDDGRIGGDGVLCCCCFCSEVLNAISVKCIWEDAGLDIKAREKLLQRADQAGIVGEECRVRRRCT